MTTTTSSFQIAALPAGLADHVRAHGADPVYGHPAHTQPATGYGPCRSCLSTFCQGGEDRILFTHDAFAGAAPFPAPGPVFVHAEPCEPYAGAGFPEDLRTLALTFEGYGEEARLITFERAAGDPEGAITRALEHEDVRYVNVRNTVAGCFVLRAERPATS